MKKLRALAWALITAGCSSFAGQSNPATEPSASAGTPKPTATRVVPAAGTIASTTGLVGAMRDKYDGKYLRTLTFLQNNTRYTTTGEEQKSQWFEHVEAPGKLRIAFLPSAQKSGLVQVGESVASFDNGMRIDFRPSVNPLLLLTVDAYSAPASSVMRALDSLGVDTRIVRADEWEGRPVYVVGAKAGDTTSNQVWIDAEHLRLLRFIQRVGRGERAMLSEIQVRSYREIEGYQIPTEILTLRNGRPVWREQRTDIRVNAELPANVFDQALWRDIPTPN
jgi:hypothetical protein